MPSKHKPRSIRFGPARDAKIDAYAAEHGIKPHAAVLELVDRGLGVVTLPATSPKQVLAQAEVAAAHLAKPKQPVEATAEVLRTMVPKPKPRRWTLRGVQLGPTPSAPGSRLKTTKGSAK